MKIAMMLFFSLVITTSVFANQASTSTDVRNSQSQNQTGGVNTVTFGDSFGTNFLPAYRQDGAFVAALPAVYVREKWLIWSNPHSLYFQRGYTMDELKRFRQPVEDKAITFGYTMTGDSGNIIPLSFYPHGIVQEIGYVQVDSRDGFFEGAVAHAMLLAKEQGNPKYCLVLYKDRDVTVGKVRSFGTSGVVGAVLGPSNPADKIAGGAVGSGYGNTEAEIKPRFMIKVISFGNLQPWQVAPPTPVVAPRGEKKGSVQIPNILFRFDNADINPNEASKLNIWADVIYSHWQDLTKSGKSILVIGSADKIGAHSYNDHLAQERAKNTAVLLAKFLHKKGISYKEILTRIKFASMGKHFPVSKQADKNRRASFVVTQNPKDYMEGK